MPKRSPLDAITQQLDDLSLDQLLEVRARVDTLINEKSSRKNESQQQSTQTRYFLKGSYSASTPISSERTDVDYVDYFVTISSSSIKGKLKSFFLEALESSKRNKPEDVQFEFVQVSELGATENGDSLEKVIDLVDEWMADESGYDEETYPQIEAALNQNHLSL
ncbi:MAG: hypothetical protein DSM106950_40135 [Stigonema ocellatum SAG 48.90 = DSM 106950]|nr:hypothetical protein [Stigonema ocellatum SAG 48.90 = DSM 106950]